MEYGSRLRFGLLVLGGILLLVLSIWGISSLAHHLIGGSSSPTSTAKKVNLADYNKSSSFVRLTVEGPVVAKEDFRSYQIEVGQNYRDFKIFDGYQKTVESDQQYSNDSNAYEAFLKSLKQENFTSKNSAYGDDQTGYCPSGQRYVYELFDHGNIVSHGWYSSCGIGTFTGIGSSTRTLFRKQIPDFDKLTEKLDLSS